MKAWFETDFEDMEQRYRAHFFQSISGYRSVVLLGTRSAGGQENLAVVSSLVHIGSNPPYLGVVFRPETIERHSLAYLRQTNAYTLNHIHSGIVEKAHQTSAKYPADTSEFAQVGLTPWYHEDFFAPYVAESYIRFGLVPMQEVRLLNECVLVVGKVVQAFTHSDLHIHPDGFVDLTSVDTITGTGQDAYFKPHFINRLPYARP